MPPKRGKAQTTAAAQNEDKKNETTPSSSSSRAANTSASASASAAGAAAQSAASCFRCSGCSKECDASTCSPLQCPNCRDYPAHLAPSYFCSQDCFTACWATHKLKHDICCIPPVPAPVMEAMFSRPGYKGLLRPGLLSPKRAVPKSVPRPDYAASKHGRSAEEEKAYANYTIPAYSPEDLADMRQLCRQGREILNAALSKIRPNQGMCTDDIDRIVHEETISRGLYPSPLNYNGFKKSCCTSINEVICHGVPDSTLLTAGDIINVDVSAFNGKHHVDLNETVFIGRPHDSAAGLESIRLVHTAFESMIAGASCLTAGNLYREPGAKMMSRAELGGFTTARGVMSHGVGKLFHSPPDIFHYAPNKGRGTIAASHIVTIEPMVNAGKFDSLMWPDEWTVATQDGRWSAQFENTFHVVADAKAFQESSGSFLPCEVLTSLSAPHLDKPCFLHQLAEFGIAVPKSRLPEMGLSEAFLGGPARDSKQLAKQKQDE